MAESQYFNKRQLALNTVTWTDVIPPIDCRYIIVRNTSAAAIKLRTDSANAATEDTIAPNGQDGITSSFPWDARFPRSQVAFALLATSGTPTVIVTYVR